MEDHQVGCQVSDGASDNITVLIIIFITGQYLDAIMFFEFWWVSSICQVAHPFDHLTNPVANDPLYLIRKLRKNTP